LLEGGVYGYGSFQVVGKAAAYEAEVGGDEEVYFSEVVFAAGYGSEVIGPPVGGGGCELQEQGEIAALELLGQLVDEVGVELETGAVVQAQAYDVVITE
jgi:hypothetical protein